MNPSEYIGLLAGFFVTCSFVPQLIRVFRLKSAHEISLLFNSLLVLGMACWLTYGFINALLPIILWNIIGGALVLTLLYAKLKYGMKKTA